MNTFAAAAGRGNDPAAGLAQDLTKICQFATVDWLKSLPRFVDDLQLLLEDYEASVQSIQASINTDDESDPREVYYAFLTQLRASHTVEKVSDASYAWYKACVRVAIAECDYDDLSRCSSAGSSDEEGSESVAPGPLAPADSASSVPL